MANEEPAPQSVSNSRPRLRVAVAVLFAVLLIVAIGVARRRLHSRLRLPSRPRALMLTSVHRVAAGPAVRALLAPLTEGSTIGAWRITMIEELRGGLIHVLLQCDNELLEVSIARREGSTVSSAVTVGAYALYYDCPPSRESEALTIMRALAERLRGHANLPMPAGFRPFTLR